MFPRPSAAAWIAAFVFVTGLRLTAQDVIVTPLSWKNPAGAPDELPTLKRAQQIDFPTELRSTPDIGYVVYDMYMDKKGQVLGTERHPTLSIFQDAFYAKRHSNESPWKPGRRAGTGVNTESTFAVIFNPASAGEKLPDATPRLLEVAVVRRQLPGETKEEDVPPEKVIPADVAVDETGQVTTVTGVPPDYARECEIAAKNWRFAPARKDGKPIAAIVHVPFIVTTSHLLFDARSSSRLPRVTFQKRPEYPISMRFSGMKGEVLVDFNVDIEGRTRNVYAVRSSSFSFEDAAVEAVRLWKFEPGQALGRPVNVHMQVPIVFELDEYGGGADAMIVQDNVDQSKLPEEYRYDTPPRPGNMTQPVYPYPLLRERKNGNAVVRYVVGPTGHVEYAKVAKASAPEFGAALVAAVECFTYQPAIKGGRPTSSLLAYEFNFSSEESMRYVHEEDLDLLKREARDSKSILSLKSLDTPLAPLSRRPPVFPASINPELTSGRAMIEFLVDEEGRVRLPRIVEATDPAFGYSAIQSLASWRFEPPMRGGRPVVVRVRIPVDFAQPKAAGSEKH